MHLNERVLPSFYHQKSLKLGDKKVVLSFLSKDDSYNLGICDGAESKFYTVIRKYLNSDSTALDVGANIGVTSFLLSQVLLEGHIFAFEPSPTIYPILKKNIEDNRIHNIYSYNFALGNTLSELKFIDNSAYGHLLENDDLGGITVSVRTLDDFVLERGLDKVDFVKIDVEGFEKDVLQGMRNILTKFKPLVYLEFNSWCQIAFKNMNPKDFLDYIIEEFSHVYFFDIDNKLTRLKEENSIAFLHDNLVRHGCVDDLIATNDPSRLELSGDYLQNMLDKYISERDNAISERGIVLTSRSWKLTSPLRALLKLLKVRV